MLYEIPGGVTVECGHRRRAGHGIQCSIAEVPYSTVPVFRSRYVQSHSGLRQVTCHAFCPLLLERPPSASPRAYRDMHHAWLRNK